MRVNENILISSLTTMRLGGPARYVLEVETPQDVSDAYGFAEQFNMPIFPLGYGANTLGHDDGYEGVIVINRMQGVGEKISANGVRLKAMGGEYWDNVVAYTTKKGLTGIEALSKIPGLVSSAPIQNIGAYGQEISQVLESIDVYDSVTKSFRVLQKSDLGFSYRQSILNTTSRNRFFVIAITLRLKSGEMPRPFYDSIEQYIEDRNITDFSPRNIREIVSTIRAEKLPDPLEIPSAGSFFKNIFLDEAQLKTAEIKGYPVRRTENGYKLNVAWLIEKSGFKGKLLHGIRVSDKAPLVLINESAKSYNDLALARTEIVNKVYDDFGFWIEQEPVELQ